MRRSLGRPLAAAVPALVLTALFLGHLARPDSLLATRDVPIFHLPLRAAFKALASDGLPLWNPTIHGGQPLLSNPNYAAFYPPTWILLAAPPHLAIGLLVIIHALLGFAGAYRLAAHLGCERGPALLAAIGFAFGGATLATTTLLNHYCGLAWLPWVLWAVLRWLERPVGAAGRRRIALPAVAFAMQILAGEPVMVLTTGLAALALATARPPRARRIARLAAACLLATLLAAVQLLPALVLLFDSPRAAGLADDRALAWSTHPVRALELVWPRAWGDPMRIDEGLFFGAAVSDREFPLLFSLYPGQLVVILALAALTRWPIRYRWAWLFVISAGGLLAAGIHNPAAASVARAVPLIASIRYPEKLLLLTTSALAFVAALGWQHLLAGRGRPGPRRDDFPLALAAILAVLNACLLGVLAARPDVAAWFARTRSSLPATAELEARAIDFFRTEVSIAFAVSCLAVGVFALHRRLRTRRTTLVVATLVLLSVDLWAANRRLTPAVPASEILRPPVALAGLDPAKGRFFTDRVFAGPPVLTLKSDRPGPSLLWEQVERADPYLATLWGFEYIASVDFDLTATAPARRALTELRSAWRDTEARRRLLGAWSVRHLGFNRQVGELLTARAAGRALPHLALAGNPYYRPPIRFEASVALHSDLESALAAERAAGHSGRQWLDPGGSERGVRLERRPRIVALDARPATVTVRYEGDDAAPLTVARTFDSGWRARLDGEPLAVYETALGMMGVLLPPGRHTLVLRFSQPGLGPGLTLSLLGIAALGMLVLLPRPAVGPGRE